MSLRDLVDRKVTIERGGVEFVVRGLSLEDIVLLLENHQKGLVAVFTAADGADWSELVHQFPNFVAAAIACGVDEEGITEEDVLRLPIGVQLEAMANIWELSSLDMDTVGKLAASIAQGVESINAGSLSQMTKGLATGSPTLPEAQNS